MSTLTKLSRPSAWLVVALALTTFGAAPSETGMPRELDTELDGADHVVVVGADDPGAEPDRFEYHAYYPSTLQVHTGDVVRFMLVGDHSVTFYPRGERQDSVFAKDELPGQVRAEGYVPSRTDCAAGRDPGHPLPPCPLDSPDQFLNIANDFLTGQKADTALVEVRLGPGTYAYFCSFHPGMQGEIEVVEDEEEIATPAEVDDERRAQVTADTAAAEALLTELATRPPVREIVDGRVRWHVQVGGRTADGRVELLRFSHPALTISEGDEVSFELPPVPGGFEWHSATFTWERTGEGDTLGFLTALDFRCDVDGKDAGVPGISGLGLSYVLTGRCPQGEFELVYAPTLYNHPVRLPGDVVAGPAPVYDSGMMANPVDLATCQDCRDPWTGQPLPHTADAFFPQAGTYTYACLIHDSRGMAGSITVTS